MPRILITVVWLLALWSCSSKNDDPNGRRYSLTGTIVRLSNDTHIAVIKHGPIKDSDGKVWMEAMTMEFPVRRRSEFSMLRVGQHIRATVHQRESDFEYWIDEIQLDEKPIQPTGVAK